MTRTIQEVRADRDRFLAQPETRAKYALQFYYSFMDPEQNRKALDRFAEFVEVIEQTPETIDY